MTPNQNQKPRHKGGQAADRPHNSIRETADDNMAKPHWSYEPGKHPALDEAIEKQAATYGTVWSPHLLGPDPISFKKFLCLPEVTTLCPIGSDARLVLEELQTLNCFNGDRDESKKALTAHIRHSALFQQRHSYRWVQRIFNSIWRNYDGLVLAKEANAAAVIGAANSALRADERRTKDAARKAASRSSDPAVTAKAVKSKMDNLHDQAARLRATAERKEVRALAMLAISKELNAKAACKEKKADELNKGLKDA